MAAAGSVYVLHRCNLSPPNIFNLRLADSTDLDHTDMKNQLYYFYKPHCII